MTSSEWPPSRPVMGYNTWYQFRTAITESEVVRQAQLLVSSGLAPVVSTRPSTDRTARLSRTSSWLATSWKPPAAR